MDLHREVKPLILEEMAVSNQAQKSAPVDERIVSGTTVVSIIKETSKSLSQGPSDSSTSVEIGVPIFTKRRMRKIRRVQREVICEDCGELCSSDKLLYHRNVLHNPNYKMRKCPHCPLEFQKKDSLWSHVVACHTNSEGKMQQRPRDRGVFRRDLLPDISADLDSTSLKCVICDKSFANELAAIRHAYYTHGEGANPDNHPRCHYCFKSFKQKATMEDHIRRVHEGKGFFCDLCPNRGDLQSAAKVWKHKVDYHGLTDLSPPRDMQVIQCEICGERMFRGLGAHIKKKHTEVDVAKFVLPRAPQASVGGQVKCSECSKEMKRAALKRHLSNIHGIGNFQIFPCPQCGREFRLRYHMKQHVRETHDRLKLEASLELGEIDFLQTNKINRVEIASFCLICDRPLDGTNKYDIGTHLAATHPEVYENLVAGKGMPPNPFLQCKFCAKKMTCTELRSHLESTHTYKCWRCPKCSKVMISSKELSFHFKAFHRTEPTNTTKPMPSSIDGRSFWNNTNLDCKRCVSSFSDKLELAEHVKCEHAECYWPCPVCEKMMYSEHSRAHHFLHDCRERRRRRNEEGDSSDARGKSKNSSLKQMGAKNITYRPLTCEVCSCSASVYRMTDHYRATHGIEEDLFTCAACNQKWHRRDRWIIHMNNDHGRSIEELMEVVRKANVQDISAIKVKNKKVKLDSKKPKRLLLKAENCDEEIIPPKVNVRKCTRRRGRPRKVYYDDTSSSNNSNDEDDGDKHTSRNTMSRRHEVKFQFKSVKICLTRLTNEEILRYSHAQNCNVEVKNELL